MKQVELSVVLPVYNERESLSQVVKEWDKVFKELNINYVFVVCEDGSDDGTQDLLIRLKNKFPIAINSQNLRRGYTRAVVDGIRASKSKYVLSIDSDGQCDPKDFVSFWKERNRFDVIKGWRHNRNDPRYRVWLSTVFGLFYQLLFGRVVRDPTAQFVLFDPKKVLTDIDLTLLMPQGWGWAFMAICKYHKLRIVEIKINHRKRFGGETRIFTISKLAKLVLTNLVGLIKIRFLLHEK